jgi:hypothetical protein
VKLMRISFPPCFLCLENKTGRSFSAPQYLKEGE